jgi:hypothetical protein
MSVVCRNDDVMSTSYVSSLQVGDDELSRDMRIFIATHFDSWFWVWVVWL